jgi:hypothetical protein
MSYLTSIYSLAFQFLLLSSFIHPVFAQQFATDVEMISFDATGDISKSSELRLAKVKAGIQPTDIFVLAHGWNNNINDARSTYQALMDSMQSVASKYSLVGDDYRSIVVGISWPSKALDETGSSPGRSGTSSQIDRADLYSSFPQGNVSGSEYAKDMVVIEDLLDKPTSDVSEADYVELSRIFAKYRLVANDNQNTEDAGFFLIGQSGRGLFDSDLSVLQALRMFSYWQMKERAGIIGAEGVRRMIEELQTTFPSSRIHLLGHSFGCKLLLSCVGANPALPRQVDTLVLLQGAVSYRAMSPSPIGGYSEVPGRVKGPIVCTYSSNDGALGMPYELASRAAGQAAVGRGRTVSKYAALGRVGPEFCDTGFIFASAKADNYEFKNGIYGLNGEAYILGHSDFNNEAVARMMWAAVAPTRSGSTGRTLVAGRSEEETAKISKVAAKTASKVVEQIRDQFDESVLLDLYTDAVEAVTAQRRKISPDSGAFFPLNSNPTARGSASNRIDADTFARNDSNSLKGKLKEKLYDARFLAVDSYKKSIPNWLVDERSFDSVARILTNDVQGCDMPADNNYKQCVGVCIRLRGQGASFIAYGSGIIIAWNTVITAAHVLPDESLLKLSADLRAEALEKYEFGISIGPGTPDREWGTLPPGTVVLPVKARIEHPSFDGSRFLNDIAVLQLVNELDSTTVFGEEPQLSELPIKLAETVFWRPEEPKAVTLVGYGHCDRSGSKGFGKRRAAENVLAAIPETEAEARIIGCHLGLEFAAGGQGIDTCKGDSGGPVLARDSDGQLFCMGLTSRPSRVRLVDGVRSTFGGEPETCGDGGVYVLLPEYSEWIRGVMQNVRDE